MRIEQEVIEGKVIPFTLDELWQFRKELKEKFSDELDGKLTEFANRVFVNPGCISPEDRDVALKIFWMMKLIPQEPNQN